MKRTWSKKFSKTPFIATSQTRKILVKAPWRRIPQGTECDLWNSTLLSMLGKMWDLYSDEVNIVPRMPPPRWPVWQGTELHSSRHHSFCLWAFALGFDTMPREIYTSGLKGRLGLVPLTACLTGCHSHQPYLESCRGWCCLVLVLFCISSFFHESKTGEICIGYTLRHNNTLHFDYFFLLGGGFISTCWLQCKCKMLLLQVALKLYHTHLTHSV